jgi:transcriptional regulator with XRE-family HTH domain
MPKQPINLVIAENLRYFMERKKITTQAALASKAGLSQRTISNYLNPEAREPGQKGKPGSAKAAELELIARALEIEAWELMRAMTPAERLFYEKVEKAYRDLVAGRPADGEHIDAPESNG